MSVSNYTLNSKLNSYLWINGLFSLIIIIKLEYNVPIYLYQSNNLIVYISHQIREDTVIF